MSSSWTASVRIRHRNSIALCDEQQFRQIWIPSRFGFIAILVGYSFLLQIVIREPFGTTPAPDLIILALFVALASSAFAISRADVRDTLHGGIPDDLLGIASHAAFDTVRYKNFDITHLEFHLRRTTAFRHSFPMSRPFQK